MTTYILKIKDKNNINKLLKYHINIKKIKYYQNSCLLYVSEEDYQKLIKYFQLYDISLYKINGLLKYKILLKQNIVFIISMFLGLIFLYLLTFITFDIKIMTNKSELIKIIKNELDYSNLKKYQFIKSFKEKEEIKNNILNNYKDKFEWIEIDRVGTKYYINILERVINKHEVTKNYQHVVAKKNAVILEIKASNGEIVHKVNDYVNKGDIIISGLIKKKEDVKDIVEASGKIYGETWYNVKVELPKSYIDKVYTGKTGNKISLNFLGKKYFLFKNNNYLNEEYNDKVIIKSNLLPISLNYTKILETKNDTYFYTYQDAIDLALSISKEKLINNLSSDSKILYQKKLKLYEENSKIIIEVFFKVYEDITDYQKITLEEGE